MHELGVVFKIKQQVEDVAKQNNVKKVTSLTIELGEVSTVVPDLFIECFDWAKKKSEYLQDCKLNLVIIKAISYCEDCKQTYSTTEFARTCPHCKSPHTYLVSGNELKIKQIEVE
jgi:hydrogenase nickel incorporation protein HypA/HybF